MLNITGVARTAPGIDESTIQREATLDKTGIGMLSPVKTSKDYTKFGQSKSPTKKKQ